MIAALEGQASSPNPPGLPPIARVYFALEALDSMRMPAYAGSAWRGLLGHSLRRTVCVTRQPTCHGCLLIGTCAYSVFFESPACNTELAGRYTVLPHPFVLDVDAHPERDVPAGADLRLGLNLIGPAIDLLPYLIQAVKVAGERGIGRAGGRFELRALYAEQSLGSNDWQCVYDVQSGAYRKVVGAAPQAPKARPDALRLELPTPLRIKRQGHFVGPAAFVPGDLLRSLISRLSMLAELYGGTTDPEYWKSLADAAVDVRLAAANLTWSDWTRFSSRQRTSMEMGGLIGEILLDGPGLAAFWPALWVGQWTHVGKGSSFGLGKYRLGQAGGEDSLRETPTP